MPSRWIQKAASGERLRHLAASTGLAIAVATIILVPVAYGLALHSQVEARLAFESRQQADRLATAVSAVTDPFQDEATHLAKLVAMSRSKEVGRRERVFDASGQKLAEVGEKAALAIATQSAPIMVAGVKIGRVDTSAVYGPSLPGIAGALLVAGLIGLTCFFSIRNVVRRVLDDTTDVFQRQALRLGWAIEAMSLGVCVFDAGKGLVACNRRFCELFGISTDAVVAGMTEGDLMRLSEVWDTRGEPIAAATGEGVLRRLDGSSIAVERAPTQGGDEVVTYEDVTQRAQAAAKIAHMARHDALTRLPNRLQFHEELGRTLQRGGTRVQIALLVLDVDHFRWVNDTLGHPVGDLLLKAIARRLRATARETDLIARIAGDEFAIVQVRSSRPSGATALATRLIEELSAPYEIEGHHIVVTTSIGIAVAPRDAADPDLLLKQADIALSRAKEEGRGIHRYFEPEMNERIQSRRNLEMDLRKGLKAGEFELLYQPVVDINTEDIVCFEALLRWNHPVRGVIQPDDFVPVADETGLIVPIGEWAITNACREATRWPDAIRVAVNLSPTQFQSVRLIPTIKAALSDSGLAPGRLELEITESILLQDDQKTMTLLGQLHEIGVRISMDDFGTGYSSLSYLRKFAFDKIKIDRSFIREMSDRDESLAIIRAVSAIGKSLGIVTTAEGVETREQFEWVRREGCSQVQGYLFGAAEPAAGVAALLAVTAIRKVAPTSGRKDAGARRATAIPGPAVSAVL